MRRGLYVVLMVVLVLRGLTGAAMAAGAFPAAADFGPAHPQSHPHSLRAVHAAVTDAVVGESTLSHHDHGHPPPEQVTQIPCDGPSTPGCMAQEHHTSNCSACEICHSAMLDLPVRPIGAGTHARTALPQVSAQFDSAPEAPTRKPPIA